MSEVEQVARTAKNFKQHMLEQDWRDRKEGFFVGIFLWIRAILVRAAVIIRPLHRLTPHCM
ncbi:hypothetical protein [Candidatus Williamhamiltonella defendens]|uniref:hypothetical protein n=1 Tax=Candidatus Williamhamiltonella defendens TaxID=138072 RepID=UPI00130DBD86|nr:hypothetical protein [Candidatus Hamiltonella defensa]